MTRLRSLVRNIFPCSFSFPPFNELCSGPVPLPRVGHFVHCHRCSPFLGTLYPLAFVRKDGPWKRSRAIYTLLPSSSVCHFLDFLFPKHLFYPCLLSTPLFLRLYMLITVLDLSRPCSPCSGEGIENRHLYLRSPPPRLLSHCSWIFLSR